MVVSGVSQVLILPILEGVPPVTRAGALGSMGKTPRNGTAQSAGKGVFVMRRKRGKAVHPQPETRDPLAEKIAQLERENARLQKQLQQAETVIEVQQKLAKILGIPLTPPNSSDET